MKISFYKTFWWKLLLCFLGVMMLTVLIVLSNFRRDHPKAMELSILDDMNTRTRHIAQIFSENSSANESLEKTEASLYKIGLISRLQITLFDTQGKIIYRTDYQDQRGPDTPGEPGKQNSSHTKSLKKPGRPDKPPGFGGPENPGGPRGPKKFRSPGGEDDIGRFHFVPRPPIQLSSEEIAKLKNAEAFSNFGNKNHQQFYSVYPLYKDGKFSGAIMTAMQFGGGPPPPMKRRFDNLLIRSTIIAVIIVSLAAFFIAGSFTKPISSMMEAVNKMSRGDFSYRINSKRDDEIAILSNAFDEMSIKIEKSIKGRMQLIADISHELMTPLASIQGCAEALIDGIVKDKEKTDKYLHIILNSTRRLALLKNDLSELSKFEYRQVKITWQSFSIIYPISRAIESVQIISDEKNDKISTDIPDENLTVVGDKDKILQVIQNLLNNAVQHNPEGTSIIISAERKDDTVTISVQDDGLGIPECEMENVFERCYKVDKSRTKGESGSGLGLAIAREIIEAHGSKIKLESSGKGAKFSFTLKVG